MEALILALQAAASLAPILETVIPLITGATKSADPVPVSAGQASHIMDVLTAATKLAPEVIPLIPLVQKAFQGRQFNDADLATLKVTAEAIDFAIERKVTEIEAGP